jgi:hypothetical protein
VRIGYNGMIFMVEAGCDAPFIEDRNFAD